MKPRFTVDKLAWLHDKGDRNAIATKEETRPS